MFFLKRYSPSQRRNILWMVLTAILIFLVVVIIVLFDAFADTNSMLLQISGFTLIFIILVTYIMGMIVSYHQYSTEASKNDFTNNLIHEIKTPITVISLACEMLQDKNLTEKDEYKEQVSTYLPIISSEVDRLKKMVDVFLQNSRIDSSYFYISKEKIDIHELIINLVNDNHILVENQNGKMLTDLKAKRHIIEGDRQQLTNVISNIIDNAIKYSNEKPLITISSADVPQGMILRVSDNGIGISKDDIEHIFENFYRVPTGDKHDVKGYGIGLHYAQKVVKMHGGNIKVSSTPGKGSVFEIFLPFNKKTGSHFKASRQS